ncbi:MAG TPA: sulfite exporter TauE/SafE family protein [Ferrovibrio sp.]|uniref:sulfite exporter TauE/SafE family protein n=1 Tax=Ferrovibrio sp. TaxID=1917215 RepID=UPI002ED48EE8
MITLSMAQTALTIGAGSAVGFSLALVGGGGSILAVPALLYLVGIGDAHLAIGTSALAVAVNAFANLAQHARKGNVKWPCAMVFAASGVLGAALGAALGKLTNGQHLLLLFAGVMMVIGLAMLRPKAAQGNPDVHLNRAVAGRLVPIGLTTGALSGFFGIGGGFLIVPGLMLGSGMPLINAIGSSLFAVGSFGLTTAISYALSGLIDWPVAAWFIVGGILGGLIGTRMAIWASGHKGLLNRIFAGLIFAVAAYIVYRSV